MGQTHTTSKHYPKPHAWFPHQPKTLSMGTITWQLQLQPKTNCPTRHQSTSAWKTKQQKYLGTPCSQRMVCQTSPTSLPMLLHMDNGNKMWMNSWHTHMVLYHCTHANDIFPRHHSHCNMINPTHTPKSDKQLSNCINNRHRNQNPETTCHHTIQQNNGWTQHTNNSQYTCTSEGYPRSNRNRTRATNWTRQPIIQQPENPKNKWTNSKNNVES